MSHYFQSSEFACRHCHTGGATTELVEALESLREVWGKSMIVNAGYRCPAHNAAIGGAPHSAHLTGEAADIHDAGSLQAYCTPEVLERHGLWAESYDNTPTWIHLQVRPASQRIFKP